MYTHIFVPLSMTSTTFRQSEIFDRLVPTAERHTPEVEQVNGTTRELVPGTSFWVDGVKDDYGGGGGYSVVSDYMKVLRSILRNDGVLLKRKTVELMFKPQCKFLFSLLSFLFCNTFERIWKYTCIMADIWYEVSAQSHQALNELLSSNRWSPSFCASISGNLEFFINDTNPNPDTDWGLGGLLSMEDVEGGRKKGSMAWSGLPNLYWVSHIHFLSLKAITCFLFSSSKNWAQQGASPGHQCLK